VPRRTSRRPSCSFGETDRFVPISFVAASPAFGGSTARWRTSNKQIADKVAACGTKLVQIRAGKLIAVVRACGLRAPIPLTVQEPNLVLVQERPPSRVVQISPPP
jgi:hypothetical protein